MFKNPLLDRTFFGASILSGWALFALFAWAFLFHHQPADWVTVMGGVCGLGLGIASLLLTIIGWRYVLTGSEFKD